MPRIRFLPLIAAILFVLAGASNAHAGGYTISYDFASDLSGWGGYVEPGYLLCGRGSPAGCPDIGTDRIMARAGAAQAIWSQGRWEWTAPPGTTVLAKGSPARSQRSPSAMARRPGADGNPIAVRATAKAYADCCAAGPSLVGFARPQQSR
jgi:hypothetical protein